MWEYIPFENCLEKTKIKFKLPKKDYKESGKYPIVSQEESLISGYHDDISYIFKVAKPIVVFGDHTLALKYIDFDFIVGADGVKILQPVEEINTKYFYYVLKALIPKTTGYARHYKLLKKLDIPVPPLAEQERIVAKLDTAFAEIDRAVDSTKSKINEGSAIYKSMARKVFFENPNKVPISEVAEIIMGQSPKGNTYNSKGKGVPLINGPVEFERDDFGKSKSIKFTTAPTKFCEAGDTLLCVRGSTTGRMNIAREASCIGRGVAALRAHEYQPWISYFIQSSRDLIYSLGKGATFPNISSKQIGEIEIYNPSAAEKQSLVFKLDKARIEKDNLIRLSESKLEQLASLKSAILKEELQSSEAA